MATHDYNLANQDGASFRSDLNNALAAIVSNNSSSTAPATTFAHQIWVDTTANVIKQRNAANDAWVELWRIDGGFNAKTFSSNVTLNAQSDLRFADSDSSNWVAFQAPATVASNVTWTLPSADGTADQALTTNGSGVLSWADAGGTTDNITEGNTSAEVVDTGSDGHFKVVTEGTEALRVTAAQRVGIANTNPGALLTVGGSSTNGTIFVRSGSNDYMQIYSTSPDGSYCEIDSQRQFRLRTESGDMRFATANTDRMRIDSSGRLLLGTSSARIIQGDWFFQVEGTNGSNSSMSLCRNSNDNGSSRLAFAKSRSTSIGGSAVVSNNDYLGDITWYGADGTDISTPAAQILVRVDGTPGSNDMPGRIEFHTTKDGQNSPTERMQIAQEGQTRIFSDTECFHAQTGQGAGTGYAVIFGRHSATGTRSGTASFLVYSNGNVLNTNNSYGSLSDIKLKENIVDAGSQWDDIKAIQVRKYNFKAETNQQTHTQLGVIAQEVELVSPGLVTESPDRGDVEIPVLDENGNAVLDENGDQVFTTEIRDLGTTTKSVNYSVLYMKAVKALQEAMERIETLEARLSALEGGA